MFLSKFLNYLEIFFWSHWSFCTICKMKAVTGNYIPFSVLNKGGWYVLVTQKILHSVLKWLIYLFFIFQLYFQVSQHKHQDNIHSSVQWKERKTGGPGVPSEACATSDLSLNNKHSRQHGSPDQPSPFSHWNYQVFKPCRSHTRQWVVAGWRPPLIHMKYFAFVVKV